MVISYAWNGVRRILRDEGGKSDRLLGVNTLQGFHFAKPMPRDEFELWLARFCH